MHYLGRLREKVENLERQVEKFDQVWSKLNDLQRQIDLKQRQKLIPAG